MKVWGISIAVLFLISQAHAQPVPENLPNKYGTKTEKNEAASCTSENKSCTDWCDKNNATSNMCKQECTWRVDYCKRTGLYPQQSRANVWVGKKE